VVSYPFGELDELVLCYATTIHKSQGSEYPVVVIPISTQHYMMLKAQSDLHGHHAGQETCGPCWSEKGAGNGGQGKQVARRWSKLKERLATTRRIQL